MPEIAASDLHRAIVDTLVERWFHLPDDEREAFACNASLYVSGAGEEDVAIAIGLLAKAASQERERREFPRVAGAADAAGYGPPRDSRGRFERENRIAKQIRKRLAEQNRRDQQDWTRLFGGWCPL